MPAPETLRVTAHAKVNLALAVGPPVPGGRPHAGYHPVASWMHAVDLGDSVEIGRAAATTYDLAWDDGRPVEWAPGQDLGVRAHRAMEALAGRALPVSLRVRKRVPAGGGLGGGSGDAAAVLLAVRDLFALNVTDDALGACAHALGTDIPFFVDPDAWRAGEPPRPALVTGLGDRVERIGRTSGGLTLVCPPFPCPTGAVYRAFDTAPTGTCDEARVRRVAGAPLDPGALFNDLCAPAERVEPRLAALRRWLAEALRAPVHVSGSGSTLFVDADPGRVASLAPGCRVVRVRLV